MKRWSRTFSMKILGEASTMYTTGKVTVSIALTMGTAQLIND